MFTANVTAYMVHPSGILATAKQQQNKSKTKDVLGPIPMPMGWCSNSLARERERVDAQNDAALLTMPLGSSFTILAERNEIFNLFEHLEIKENKVFVVVFFSRLWKKFLNCF